MAEPIPPRQLNIEPLGPQVKREIRERLPGEYRKPKHENDGIADVTDTASDAKQENPQVSPSTAPKDTSEVRNSSSQASENPWLHSNGSPWISEE